MNLFLVGLSRLKSKEGKTDMLIGSVDLARLMIHLQQVNNYKLRDREKFTRKRAKTGKESRQ